jgi:diamine N-acetyltransferase
MSLEGDKKINAPITLTGASQADIPVIRKLSDSIWHECYPAIITNEQIDYMLGWMYSDKMLSEELSRGVMYVIVKAGPEAIGYYSYELESKNKTIKIHKIYLLSAWHGFGIGQRMMDDVVTHARSMGAERVYLTVNKGNAKAIASYQRAGFSVIDSIVTDIGHGFVMNDYVFSKDL